MTKPATQSLPPKIVRLLCTDQTHKGRKVKQGQLCEDCGWYGMRWTCLACGRVTTNAGEEHRHSEPLSNHAERESNLARARRIIDLFPKDKP